MEEAKPRRRGQHRARVPASQKKSRTIAVPLSPAQFAHVETLSRLQDITLAEVLRRALDKYVLPEEVPGDREYELAGDLLESMGPSSDPAVLDRVEALQAAGDAATRTARKLPSARRRP